MPTKIFTPIDESAATTEQIARFFPQLEIIAPLGRGPLGPVFKARCAESDRLLALHVIATESAGASRLSDDLAREAERLANFRHPHVASVFGFGEVPGTCRALHFLLAEHVEGLSLRPVVELKKLAPRDTLAIVCQICEILQAAHDQQLAHGDVKPENVLVDKSGQIMIVDLGLKQLAALCAADAGPASPTNTQAADLADHRDDIVALGSMLYEMLTGEPPCGDDVRPSQRVDVDPRLDEIVQRALTDDPQRRYQQAIDLKKDIQRLAQPLAQTAEPKAEAEVTAADKAEAKPDTKGKDKGKAVVDVEQLTTTTPAQTAPRRGANGDVEPLLLPQCSRKAILGVVLIPFILLAPAVFILAKLLLAGNHLAGGIDLRFAWQWEWLYVAGPLGLSVALVSAICGALAIRDIRRSDGMLTGLGLAFFDVVLLPLLVIDAAIYGLCHIGAMHLLNVPPYLPASMWALPACLFVDLFFIRWAWRRAIGHRPDNDLSGPGAKQKEEVSADNSSAAKFRKARFPVFTLFLGLVAMALTYTPWVTVDDKPGQFNEMQTYVGPIHINENWLCALTATRLPYTAWDSGLAFRQQDSLRWFAEVPNSALFFVALVIVLLALVRCMGVGVHAALQIVPFVLAICAGGQAWLINCVSVQFFDELHYAPLLLFAVFNLMALAALGTMLLAVCRTLLGRFRREPAEHDLATAPAHGLSA